MVLTFDIITEQYVLYIIKINFVESNYFFFFFFPLPLALPALALVLVFPFPLPCAQASRPTQQKNK